jgi:hypothetical protein
MASPVTRWVNNMTWMATLRPLRTSSSTSLLSSATRVLWALTSGLMPLRSWKKVWASSITTWTKGQEGEGPRCQASAQPSHQQSRKAGAVPGRSMLMGARSGSRYRPRSPITPGRCCSAGTATQPQVSARYPATFW